MTRQNGETTSIYLSSIYLNETYELPEKLVILLRLFLFVIYSSDWVGDNNAFFVVAFVQSFINSCFIRYWSTNSLALKITEKLTLESPNVLYRIKGSNSGTPPGNFSHYLFCDGRAPIEICEANLGSRFEPYSGSF
jgi:hypothetical protein